MYVCIFLNYSLAPGLGDNDILEYVCICNVYLCFNPLY